MALAAFPRRKAKYMSEVPEGPVAAVHIADVGKGAGVKMMMRKKVDTASVPGLRSAELGLAAEFGHTPPRPQLGRVGLISFWDDDAAIDEFNASAHPMARALAGGWHARLEPLRAHGAWPGLPEDVNRSRTTERPGPYVVFTLGRFKWSRFPAFVRTSGPAEKAVLKAGASWVGPIVRPPFVSTVSIWDSQETIAAYAYGAGGNPHPAAITAGRKKPFHHQEAFIRFHPYRVQGSLGGKNPLPAGLLEAQA